MRAAIVAWLGIGTVLALLAQVLFENLWVLAAVPVLVWAVSGLILLVLALWRARQGEQRRRHLLLSIAVALGLLLFLPAARVGSWVTATIRFVVQRATYEAIVARESSAPSAEGLHDSGGLRYVMDLGPPLRIAFIWPGGLIDNWCGAVYDPSGVVMRSSDFDGDWATWHDQVPTSVIELFGGDLVHCEELAAPYYHCCFT
ncbi:MAG: hypothetical protein R3F21_09645 [Myxococcota bacterium]